jgi:hypothetical protein
MTTLDSIYEHQTMYLDTNLKLHNSPLYFGEYSEVIVPEDLRGSDYLGTTTNRSNYLTFIERYGETVGVHAVTSYYGFYAVAIIPEALTEDMIVDLNNLQLYPLLDEDHHSELEVELQSEQWETDTSTDFRFAIEEALDTELDMDDEALYELFVEKCDETNTYWNENQEGCVFSIDLSRLVDAITIEEVVTL